MKIYTKIVLDKNNNLLEEKSYDYQGNTANAMGIHYTYGANKGNKLMEKQAKREKKLAEKKAKRALKEGPKEEEAKPKALDTSKPITLDFLTNPDKE
jgi:hypothetical protein